MPRRYPLEPLAKLRQAAVDAEAEQLAVRIRRHARAEEAATAHRWVREAEEHTVERALAGERARLREGQLSPADLAHAENYAEASSRRIDRLRQAEHEAHQEATEARDDESRARRSLERALGRSTVLERHRARWAREVQREAELSDEEAADDALPLRRGSR